MEELKFLKVDRRFRKLIESGEKTTTICPEDCDIEKNDVIHMSEPLYQGMIHGFKRARCCGVQEISIANMRLENRLIKKTGVYFFYPLNECPPNSFAIKKYKQIELKELLKIVKSEGFEKCNAFFLYIKKKYGLPFNGKIIHFYFPQF